jgi:hypothetical protein
VKTGIQVSSAAGFLASRSSSRAFAAWASTAFAHANRVESCTVDARMSSPIVSTASRSSSVSLVVAVSNAASRRSRRIEATGSARIRRAIVDGAIPSCCAAAA